MNRPKNLHLSVLTIEKLEALIKAMDLKNASAVVSRLIQEEYERRIQEQGLREEAKEPSSAYKEIPVGPISYKTPRKTHNHQ